MLNHVKIPLEPINKLDLSCKASLAAILVTFHQNSCKKIGQKACLNITQVAEQVAAEIGATLGCELSTHVLLLQVCTFWAEFILALFFVQFQLIFSQ